MPRFHFNVHGRKSYADPDGQVLADLSAARQEALRYADGLSAGNGIPGLGSDPWHMDITDTAGAVLFRLDLGTARSPG